MTEKIGTVPSVVFDGRKLVFTDRQTALIQSGPTVLLMRSEVEGTLLRLDRYLAHRDMSAEDRKMYLKKQKAYRSLLKKAGPGDG